MVEGTKLRHASREVVVPVEGKEEHPNGVDEADGTKDVEKSAGIDKCHLGPLKKRRERMRRGTRGYLKDVIV